MPGGFMADSCVHHMATLRTLATAAAAGRPLRVTAATSFSDSGLSPPDTAVATISWESGLISSVSLCMIATSVRIRICAVLLLQADELAA
jgi:predicted dehydrogenase